jgi:hypothetical protein
VRWEYFDPFIRSYKKCLGTPFLGVIHSDDCLYPCLPYTLGKEEFRIGNLAKHPFEKLWFGKRHKEILRRLENMDLGQCPQYCRPHHVNKLLWELSEPPTHVNFI